MSEMQMFQLFGLTFFAAGIGMFVNPKFVPNISQELQQSAASMFYGGLISLLIGFFLVSFHNVWKFSPGLILTVMGWMAIFKGMFLLIAPKSTMKMYKKILKTRSHFVSYFVTGLGIISLYFGFFA